MAEQLRMPRVPHFVTRVTHVWFVSPHNAQVVEGVDILIVRELVGGIYFGEPRVRADCFIGGQPGQTAARNEWMEQKHPSACSTYCALSILLLSVGAEDAAPFSCSDTMLPIASHLAATGLQGKSCCSLSVLNTLPPICFPPCLQGFKEENGERVGYNTMVYR